MRHMRSQLLDGKVLSSLVRQEVRERTCALLDKGVRPRLDVLVAAQDDASLAYVRMKRAWCEKAGIESRSYEVTAEWTQAQLISRIRELNADPKVHGVLIQHPLPPQLDEKEALLTLGAEKDVDGITPASLGRLVADLPGFRCATPLGMMKLLDHFGIECE